MTKCPWYDDCFNAGHDLICNSKECDRTEATFRLTNRDKIDDEWKSYCCWCRGSMNMQQLLDMQDEGDDI